MPYETIDVPEGEHELIEVGSGETLEHTLIDVSRDGASASIDARGTNWTIRDVGFEGVQDEPERPLLKIADRGGNTSVIDYVFLGDGDGGGHREALGCYVDARHSGHIMIARTRIEHMSEGGFHLADPTTVGNGGTVRLKQCYAGENWQANYIIGDGELDECTAVADETPARGVWARGETRILNSHLECNGEHYALHAGYPGVDVEVTLEESQYDDGHDGGIFKTNGASVGHIDTGTSPSSAPPAVPDSAEDAAEGADEPIMRNPPTEDNYEVITADNSMRRIGGGDIVENKLIDFSNGNYLRYHFDGDGTLRNVGFTGTHRHDENCITVGGSAGEVRVENVYLGDGCVRPANYRSHGQCGVFVHRDFSGDALFRNVNVQNWPNNGLYANPPYYNGGGTVRIEDCYGANNYVSNFRIGSNGSYIRNCVSFNDNNGRYTGRPLWAWGQTVSVEGCRMDSGPYRDSIHIRDTTTVEVSDTVHDGYNYGGNGNGTVNEGANVDSSGGADLTPPEGVPGTAVEAASGTGGTAPSTGGPGGGTPGDGGDGDDDEPQEPTHLIEASPGEHVTLSVTGADELADRVIDLTASNTAATIYAEGDDWTIRNVAFAGVQNLSHSPPCFAILATVYEGGTGEIEQCYLGDGSTVGPGECGETGRGAIHVGNRHEGELQINDCFIANWPAEGVSGLHAGPEGGPVRINGCYFEDVGYAYATLATEGSALENSVISHNLGEPEVGGDGE